MSDQEQIEMEAPEAAADESDAKVGEAENLQVEQAERQESVPEFQELQAKNSATGGRSELKRFGGVQVVLTAELGRTQITIQELMGLSEGAILELHREISAPVELVAQGVPLGNGEVVVVDDRFAIRIKQIYQV
jgi:flagellar motor switch protein FliN/FliY